MGINAALRAYHVEDHADIRSTLMDGMQELIPIRFVSQAINEPQALTWLAANPEAWDVIIIDLFLREGSGFGVLQACRHRLPHQKAVVLTSYVDQDVVDRCTAMDADAVFDKNDQLEALVKFCLDHAEDLSHTHNALLASGALPSPAPHSTASQPVRSLAKLARHTPKTLPPADRLVPWRDKRLVR